MIDYLIALTFYKRILETVVLNRLALLFTIIFKPCMLRGIFFLLVLLKKL